MSSTVGFGTDGDGDGTERGSVCERMPQLADALATGVVSAGHVDAVADAARRLDEQGRAQLADHEASLVDAAARLTPEEFERECRDLARNLSGDDELSRHERLRRQRNARRWGRQAHRNVQDDAVARSAR